MMKRILLLAIGILILVAPSFAAPTPTRAALNSRLPDVNFNAVALADAIDFLRDASKANIHVNWRAIQEAGVGKDTPVNIRLRGATLRKILGLVLTEAAGGADLLTFYNSDGVLEVTTRELADKDMFTRVYPVQDLLVEVPDFNNAPDFNLQQSSGGGRGGGGGQQLFNGSGGGNEADQGPTRAERSEQLINLITSTIQPDVWQVNGGAATIRFFNGNLVVHAPRSVHEALGGIVD